MMVAIGIRSSGAKAASLFSPSCGRWFTVRVQRCKGVICTNLTLTMLLPEVPLHLQEEARVLLSWANCRGASSRQASRILALLNVEFLCSSSLPPCTHRKPNTPEFIWRRYMFHRHVQHILRWTTRREESDPEGFGNEVNTIIRERLFPTHTFSTMARLKSMARERGDQCQVEQVSRTPALAAMGSASEAMSLMGTTGQESAPNWGLRGLPNLVPAIGEGPPLGDQEIPLTPPRSPDVPNYTWERTTPMHGKQSGLFMLHLASTPQSEPMSRDPPNQIVNREQLKQALRGKLNRARRGENGVKRNLLDQGQNGPVDNARGTARRQRGRGPTRVAQRPRVAVAPPGWGPPEIRMRERSPVQLRPRMSSSHGEVPVHTPHLYGKPENGGIIKDDDVRFFNPGASPPHALLGDPLHSLSDHNVLDNRLFPEIQHVTVISDTLGLDSGLVGDEHGLSGVVLSRFYHHVTGTPMFQVNFGDVIGTRSVRVCDTAADVTRAFGDTQRTLFLDDEGIVDREAGPSQPEVQVDSDDDPEWQGAYEDFHSESANGGSSSDGGHPTYTENPLRELGLYSCAEDVSDWPFVKAFADDQWQEQSTTLLQNTHNFSGLVPGPTVAVASRPMDYFLRFWPPQLLERVIAETNRYALQPSQLNPAVTNGRVDWTPLDSEELLAWYGILILMGLKEFPHIRCYWDRLPFYNCPLISEAMPRKRFEAIIRCLHLVDNEALVTDRTSPAYDQLAKVRWVCESLARISQSLYNNERVLTVDEIMIPYKGRFCNIRQYMKSKPVKFGVKVWALANSESRYVSNIVYLGADDSRTVGDSVGEDAVLTAIANLEGRGHVVVTDNFFTSPRLFMELLRRGFWATGTCRKTRKGFPSSLAGFS